MNYCWFIVQLFISKLGTNSRNSSKPPSQDQNRDKSSAEEKPVEKKKPGGQNGHIGNCLKLVKNPDKIVEIEHDRSLLPAGEYVITGYEARQVVDIEIKKVITEYRAEILTNRLGASFTANFPNEVTQKIQYGKSIKSHAVYMSQFQLIPYARVCSYFASQMGIALSLGSLFNFNQEAYNKLETFDQISKNALIASKLINVDETGINASAAKIWLHSASNDLWTYFYPHKRRGTEAMDEIGILPNFSGVMCHDHWKPYYTYKNCIHSLCNAHHIRELQKVIYDYKHEWAEKMQKLS